MKKYKLITNILFLILVAMQINISAMTAKQKWLIGGGVAFVLHNVLTLACMEYGRGAKIDGYANRINKYSQIFHNFDATKKANELINSQDFTNHFNAHQNLLSTLFTKDEWVSRKQSMTTATDEFLTKFQQEIIGVLGAHRATLKGDKAWAEKHPISCNVGSMLNASRPGYKAWFLINMMIPASSLFFVYRNNN